MRLEMFIELAAGVLWFWFGGFLAGVIWTRHRCSKELRSDYDRIEREWEQILRVQTEQTRQALQLAAHMGRSNSGSSHC